MENAVEKEQFEITDDAKAEWALGKIREAQAEQSKFAEYYKTQLAKISEQTEETVSYFQSLLAAYFETVPHRATKTGIEKFKLPSGELVKSPASVDYERDPVKLLAWAKKNSPNGEYFKVMEEPKWTDIKKHIKETGDIPDGVTPVEKSATFDVKLNELSVK